MNWYVRSKKNKTKLQIIRMSKFHENLHDILVEVAKDNIRRLQKISREKKKPTAASDSVNSLI